MPIKISPRSVQEMKAALIRALVYSPIQMKMLTLLTQKLLLQEHLQECMRTLPQPIPKHTKWCIQDSLRLTSEVTQRVKCDHVC